MQPDSAKLLEDIRAATEFILRVTRGKTFENYQTDELLRPAVERNFEIIGEALVRLNKRDPETAARIPDHRRIIAFRNVLIHVYDAIDDSRVWDAVVNHLPPLGTTVKAMLEEGSST